MATKMKFIVLTFGWDDTPFYGAAIAKKLTEEGYDVTLGYADERITKDKANNTKTFDGIVKKYHIDKLIPAMKKMDNKDSYFIICDHSELYKYAEELVSSGFNNGLFQTKADFELEKKRELGMELVKKYYKGIDIIPFTEHNTIEEATKFLNENEGVFVIQSKGDFVSTYVPQTDEPEVAKEQSIGQLNKFKKDYQKGGIILKTKLINPVEITPQIVFYNGKPVYNTLDLETKNIGDGQNNGYQVGCGTNLIISTDADEKLNTIAFPQIVTDMAKKHTGMFVWDISIYLYEGKMYFGEFCANRMGFDACFTEMDMSGGAGKYFESVMEGKNPLRYKFGTSVRIFDLEKKGGQEISYNGIEDHTWILECVKNEDKLTSTQKCVDLAVLTSYGNTIEEAVDKVYDYKDSFSFKEFYSKTKSDFLSDYPTSIMSRFNSVNHDLIEAPEYMVSDDGSETSLMNHIKSFVSMMKRNSQADAESKVNKKVNEKVLEKVLEIEKKSKDSIDKALSEEKEKHEEEMKSLKDAVKEIIYEDDN